ncbi:MAG TPA: phage holin family protein, partial [Actinomycetota bacterium]|nr:phage holin family protein [Actinomycetota bacterium]
TTNGSGYEEVPIGDLIRGIAEDASTLVRKELDLAKQEVTEGIKGRAIGLGMLAGAAILGIIALTFVGSTIAYALDNVMPAWLSRLIVTLLYLGGAAGVAVAGTKAMKRGSLTAETARETMKEDVRWAKEQLTR